MKPLNSVLLAFKDWEDRKQDMQPILKAADDRTLAQLQLQHLREASHRLRHTARPDERPFLALLHNHIARLEKQLRPNWLLRQIYRLKDRYIDGPKYMQQREQQRRTNMEALKQQLRDTGLQAIAGKLEEHLNPDHRQVCLPLDYQYNDGKRINLDVHFAKDAYGNFQLHRLEGTLLDKGEVVRQQPFDLKDWPDLAAKHVINLLDGQALKQNYTDATGHENQRWVDLGENGPRYYTLEHYDLKKAIDELPGIKRLQDSIESRLEDGHRIPVNWIENKTCQIVHVQADPANRTVKIFDKAGQQVSPEQLWKNAQQKRNVIDLSIKPRKRNNHHHQRI